MIRLVEDRYQEVLCFPPDATEEKCNAESLADDGEGEDVTADVLAAVEDAVLVGAVAARPPLLAGVVEQFAHGHWTRYGAKQSDQQPLDTQSQASCPAPATPTIRGAAAAAPPATPQSGDKWWASPSWPASCARG